MGDTYNTSIANDFCYGVNANLKGKIVLIRRGVCNFDTKAIEAFLAGAEYVLFYNDVPGYVIPIMEFGGFKALDSC